MENTQPIVGAISATGGLGVDNQFEHSDQRALTQFLSSSFGTWARSRYPLQTEIQDSSTVDGHNPAVGSWFIPFMEFHPLRPVHCQFRAQHVHLGVFIFRAPSIKLWFALLFPFKTTTRGKDTHSCGQPHFLLCFDFLEGRYPSVFQHPILAVG